MYHFHQGMFHKFPTHLLKIFLKNHAKNLGCYLVPYNSKMTFVLYDYLEVEDYEYINIYF